MHDLTRQQWYKSVLATTALAAASWLLASAALAQPAGAPLPASALPEPDGDGLPPLRRQGDVAYRTGGITEDESQALKQVAGRFPLTMLFAVHVDGRDAYAANVHVIVRNARQQPVLDVVSDGPYLLVDLQPGRYSVEAELSGQSRRQMVSVKKGASQRLTFVWPHD